MRYASVCDGIGAAHVAWRPLGWECAWTSEIEPFPAAVVDHHFGFANIGDMTKITEEMLNAHGPVDLLVGGTPCQSFSVAGLRGGLADPRGNLALRFVQLAAVMQPKWIVWENVPGVLSSGGGKDFGTFLGALGELGYGFAYRVLDAQWFGVAQRRRRVFVVGYLGDWRRAAAVLFERESVFGNPPTRGATGQGTAARSQGGTEGGVIWRGGDQANSEHCQDHAGTLNCDKGQQGGIIAEPHAIYSNESRCDNTTYVAFAQNQREEIRDLGDCSTALSIPATHQQTFLATPFTKAKRAQSTTDDETWVQGEVSPTMSCFDSGDTRATTVVAQGFTYSGYSNQPAWMTGDRTDCLPSSGHSDGSHQGVGVIAFTAKDSGDDASRDIAPTMRSMNNEGGNANGGGQIAVALPADSGSHQTNYVAYDVHGTLATKGASQTDCHTALRSRPPGQSEASTTTVVAVQDCSGREKRQNGKGWNGDGTSYTVDAAATQGVAFAIDGGNQSASEEIHHSLRTGRDGGDAVAFKPSHYTRGKDGAPSEVTAPLSADADKGDQDTVVACNNTGAGWWNEPEQVAATIRRECDRASVMAAAVVHPMAVRRLTPRECERLQGFPDDYTLVEYRKKPAADGPRYRALGNSMAVPVMRWIGERIAMVDRLD